MNEDTIVLVDTQEGIADLARRLEMVDEVAMDCEGE